MATLIKNGRLIDPINRVDSKLDLLIENGRVVQVGIGLPEAQRVIDAQEHIVCPGFVDVHMHEDPMDDDGIRFDIFNAMLRMGVTTAVGGNCGLNVFDPLKYLQRVDQSGAPVNVSLFAGHQFFREQAGALDKYAPIEPVQMERMLEGLSSALAGGCVGVSFGLRYVPGTSAVEFLAAVALLKKSGRPFSIHVRDDADQIFAAVDEALDAARSLHVPVQISHIGSMGGFGQMDEMLRRIDAAREEGLDVSCDCYPYAAFSTRIGETTYDDGWLERYHCDYSACIPCEGKYAGQHCDKAIFDELRQDDPECITVCEGMRIDDVRMALMHPNVMLGSDGLFDNGQGHPRAAGSFPRFYHRMVENGPLRPIEGIAKMGAMAAERLGFTAKGRLNVGADADIVIFDPHKLCDRASFVEPALPPQGIDYVLVGGEIAARAGVIIRDDLGRALRAQ